MSATSSVPPQGNPHFSSVPQNELNWESLYTNLLTAYRKENVHPFKSDADSMNETVTEFLKAFVEMPESVKIEILRKPFLGENYQASLPIYLILLTGRKDALDAIARFMSADDWKARAVNDLNLGHILTYGFLNSYHAKGDYVACTQTLKEHHPEIATEEDASPFTVLQMLDPVTVYNAQSAGKPGQELLNAFLGKKAYKPPESREEDSLGIFSRGKIFSPVQEKWQELYKNFTMQATHPCLCSLQPSRINEMVDQFLQAFAEMPPSVKTEHLCKPLRPDWPDTSAIQLILLIGRKDALDTVAPFMKESDWQYKASNGCNLGHSLVHGFLLLHHSEGDYVSCAQTLRQHHPNITTEIDKKNNSVLNKLDATTVYNATAEGKPAQELVNASLGKTSYKPPESRGEDPVGIFSPTKRAPEFSGFFSPGKKV